MQLSKKSFFLSLQRIITWFGIIFLLIRKHEVKQFYETNTRFLLTQTAEESEGSDTIITRNGPDVISKLESWDGRNS